MPLLPGDRMKYYNRFFYGIIKDFKLFIWILILLMVFRIVFIFLFKNQLVDEMNLGNIGLALWYGGRLSLKTSGIFLAISFILSTLISLFSYTWYERISNKIRQILAYITTFVFTILFFIRIPYYEIFNASFNIMLINGAKDDILAILNTAIESYGLLWRLPLAIIIGGGVSWIGWKCINYECSTTRLITNMTKPLSNKDLVLRIIVWLALIICGSIFIRYGGAFSYSNSINWESASRLPSNLLNESILDDGQALYRVYSSNKRLKKARNLNLTEDELKSMIALVGGNDKAPNIDEAFKRTIKEKRLSTQPNMVVFILGESYGLWPYLNEFKGAGSYLVSEGESLAHSPNSLFFEGLGFGAGTMGAVNGYVTGLPDVGLYPNYEKETYTQKYGFGIGNMMKKFGYKTVFWYGGFGAWQDIRNFTLSQGFDEFYEANSFKVDKENAWGVPDKVLFNAVEEYMKNHKGEKVFHFILTTSNHPPYDINVEEEGFNRVEVTSQSLENLPKDEKTIKQMGHIWYADHVMGNFIKTVETDNPSTLFILTGDHSERFTFSKEVDYRTHSAIPIIIHGQGLNSKWRLPQHYASSIQLIPTLAELVGEPGYIYESLVPSIFDDTPVVFNYNLFIDSNGYHKIPDDLEGDKYAYVKAISTIATWRVVRGNKF